MVLIRKTYFGYCYEFLLCNFFRPCLIYFRPFLWHKSFLGFQNVPIRPKNSIKIISGPIILAPVCRSYGELFWSPSCISINGFTSLFGNDRCLHSTQTNPTKLIQIIKRIWEKIYDLEYFPTWSVWHEAIKSILDFRVGSYWSYTVSKQHCSLK